jgi:hypothetical protein
MADSRRRTCESVGYSARACHTRSSLSKVTIVSTGPSARPAASSAAALWAHRRLGTTCSDKHLHRCRHLVTRAPYLASRSSQPLVSTLRFGTPDVLWCRGRTFPLLCSAACALPVRRPPATWRCVPLRRTNILVLQAFVVSLALRIVRRTALMLGSNECGRVWRPAGNHRRSCITPQRE